MSEQAPPPPYGPRIPEHLSRGRRPDWLGRHTVAGLLAGGACAAILGWFLFAGLALLEANPPPAAARFENQVLHEAYDEAWDQALEAAIAEALVIEFADRVVRRGEGGDAPWAIGFRDGWADGWNDALAAMRHASIDAGLGPDSIELRVLNDEPRRTSGPP